MDYQSSRSKKKSSRKSPRKKAAAVATSNGTADSTNGFDSDDDCESVKSFASSVDSFMPDDNTEDGIDYHEDFENKLLESIEGARQKGARARQACLLEVKKGLCRRYINDIIITRKETILDFVEKLLKKGQQEDRILSAAISCALCIQLGDGESLKIFDTLKPILISLINDDSVSPSARASAASALGLCCFIGAEEMEDIADCLTALKVIFFKKVPADTSAHITFANSLMAWGLLLTVASQSVVEEQIENCVPVICKLLELGGLNLRIAAGETVALMYELGRQSDVFFSGPVHKLYDLLRELANESGRHKGKREKRQQKSSFRDIWKSVESKIPPDETIKFGMEYIQMTSWTWLRRYNAFKDALGSGTNTHLESNMLLREIFDLGIPVTKEMKQSKASKYEKQLMNAATSKTRTQKRNHRRDNKHSAANI